MPIYTLYYMRACVGVRKHMYNGNMNIHCLQWHMHLPMYLKSFIMTRAHAHIYVHIYRYACKSKKQKTPQVQTCIQSDNQLVCMYVLHLQNMRRKQ